MNDSFFTVSPCLMNSNQNEQLICESVCQVKVIDSTTHSLNDTMRAFLKLASHWICLPVMFKSTSQERLSNNILRARVLKELTCWNGSKDPQIELLLERTAAQDWTNNYQHLSLKSIRHKVKLLPCDVYEFPSGILEGDLASKVHTIQRES